MGIKEAINALTKKDLEAQDWDRLKAAMNGWQFRQNMIADKEAFDALSPEEQQAIRDANSAEFDRFWGAMDIGYPDSDVSNSNWAKYDRPEDPSKSQVARAQENARQNLENALNEARDLYYNGGELSAKEARKIAERAIMNYEQVTSNQPGEIQLDLAPSDSTGEIEQAPVEEPKKSGLKQLSEQTKQNISNRRQENKSLANQAKEKNDNNKVIDGKKSNGWDKLASIQGLI